MSQSVDQSKTYRRPTAYRSRVLTTITPLLQTLTPAQRALDYGSGDGWFASQFAERGFARKIIAADVLLWKATASKLVLIDGRRLPFADQSFDLTYAIDVLHHCTNPEETLDEVLRCTSDYFLIKDHTYESIFGWLTLCVLDELGNRRFAVPSRYRYQRSWSWSDHLVSRGFALQNLVHPAPCHTGLLGSLTNHLQFVALWRRASR